MGVIQSFEIKLNEFQMRCAAVYLVEANAKPAIALPSTKLILYGKDEIIIIPRKEGHCILSNDYSRI